MNEAHGDPRFCFWACEWRWPDLNHCVSCPAGDRVGELRADGAEAVHGRGPRAAGGAGLDHPGRGLVQALPHLLHGGPSHGPPAPAGVPAVPREHRGALRRAILVPGRGRGFPRWSGDPTWDPRPRGILNRGGRGSPPPSGEAEWGDLTPQGPSSPLFCLLFPETFPLPMGLAALLTWPVLDLVDVSAVRRKERSRRQSTPSSCPRLCPTAPPFCLLGSSLPGVTSRTQRPSPWCQLPASVFPAAPGSGSYSCPPSLWGSFARIRRQLRGPRTPGLKRSSGLPPPAHGRSSAASCSSTSVCPLPVSLLVALGHGVQQGPGERKGVPRPGRDPQGTWLCGVVGS